MTNGFFLSTDALLATLLVAAVLLATGQGPPPSDWSELLVLQKIHDLQKIWSQNARFDFAEMIQDTKRTFPASNFKLQKNNEVFESQKNARAKSATSSEMMFVGENLETIRIRLTVHH